MKNKTIFWIMSLALMLLFTGIVSASAPQVLNISLQGPQDGYLTSSHSDNVSYTFYVEFNETNTATNCTVYVGSTSKIATVSTASGSYWSALTTIVGSDYPPGLTGSKVWMIGCDSNASGSMSGFASSTRDIIFDTVGPTVSVSQAVSLFGEGTRDFTYTPSDTLDSGALDCDLYLDNVSVLTGVIVNNGSQKTSQYPVTGDGYHDWYVSCEDNAVPTANVGNSTLTTFTVDAIDPNIVLIQPADNYSVPGNTSVSFSFAFTDDWSNTADCDLELNGSVENSTTANNASTTSFNAKKTLGTYNWMVNCTDLYGNENNSVTRSVTYDASGPYINLSNAWPSGYNQVRNSSIYFNYSFIDDYTTTGFTCNLFVDGNEVNSQTALLNNTNYAINYTFTADGTYLWYIECSDQYGNTASTTPWTVVASLAPTKPILWQIGNAVSSAFSTIIGYIDRYGDIFATTVSVNYGYVNTSSNQTHNYPIETNYNGSTKVGTVYPLSSNTFGITNLTFMTTGNLTTGSYLRFANHNRTNFFYYDVTGITNAGSVYTIAVTPSFENNISVGERVYIYDRDRPTGWFNLTIPLHQGMNNLTVVGSHHNIQGPEYTQLVYYDNQAPVLNLTVFANVTPPNATFIFTAEDDYNLSLETVYVELTQYDNASNKYYFVTNGTAINTSNMSLGNDTIECALTGIDYALCNFTISIEDYDYYNLTLWANDSFNNQGSISYTNITVKSTVLPVPDIWHVWGSTTPNATFLVEWNESLDPFLTGYELSVGTLPGLTDAVGWFAINSTPLTYLVNNSSIQYGQIYYVNIRPVDMAGNKGASTSTELIYTMDPSHPVKNNLEIVPDAAVGNWINDPTRLNLSWNFTDAQTGVVSYQYAVGTTDYNTYSGWQDVIAQTTSGSSTGVYITTVNLTEGEQYYLNARAKNGYPYSTLWSAWYSSAPVTLDSQAPINASISYPLGDLVTSSIQIDYGVGNDSGIGGAYNVSGLDYAKLVYKITDFSNNQCDLFGSWITINASMQLTNNGVYNYNVQSGKCYQFGIKVYDQAGNSRLTTYSVGSNVTVDTTPPSTVNISGTPTVVAENTLSFSWTPSLDPESGLDYYRCALGNTSGGSEITGWMDCGTSTHVTLYNLSLENAEIYYFTVQPINNHGVSGNPTTSYGLLYFDMYPPQPLTVYYVGGDFESSDGWLDAMPGTNYTNIVLNGEADLSCVWSYYDVAYADPAAAYVQGCNLTNSSSGVYSCKVENITEGSYDVHIACKDPTGNVQTASNNTDVSFGKELVGPVINITYPQTDGAVISETNPTFTVSITDQTMITQATYALYDASTQILLESGNLTGNYSINLDLTNYSGEKTFNITAKDLYNHTTTAGRTFFANDGAPYVDASYTQSNTTSLFSTTVYTNSNLTIDVIAYFVDNVTYQILNATGDLVTGYNYSWTNTTNISTKHIFNITLNESDFTTDGSYTLVFFAEGNESFDSYQENRTIIFDRQAPTYDISTLDISPSTIYENQTDVNYYLVIADDNLNQVMFNYTVDNQSYEIQATLTTPRPWHPQETRYLATIPSYNLIANASISSFWEIDDLAGNSNTTSSNVTWVGNRAPNITTTELVPALSGTSYIDLIYFTDEDESQTVFTCDIAAAPMGLTVNHTPNTNFCVFEWNYTVAGSYMFNVSVYDTKNGTDLLFDWQQLILTVDQQANYTITLDVNSYDFDMDFETYSTYVADTVNSGTGIITATVPQSTIQNVTFSRPEYSVTAYNVEQDFPLSFYFRKNASIIENSTYNLGYTTNERYRPVIAHATNVSIESQIEESWSNTSLGDVYSGPVYNQGVLYYGTDDGYFVARNATTGSLIWNHTSAPGSYITSTTLVNNDEIYFTDETYLYAYYSNGTQIWNTTNGSGAYYDLAQSGELLVSGQSNGDVYCLNISDSGSAIWNTSLGLYIPNSVVISGNTVFLGHDDGMLYALNLTDGAILWNYTTGNAVYGAPLVVGEYVYIGSKDNHIYALNISNNGSQIWNRTLNDFVISTPAISGNTLYVGDDAGTLWALNSLNGSVIWSTTLDSAIQTEPQIEGTTIYLGTEQGYVYALDLQNTGAQLWNYSFDPLYIYESVEVNSGVVYVGTAINLGGNPGVHALTINEPTASSYKVTFNYSELGITGDDVAKLDILKYPYDESTEEIRYDLAGSGDGVLTSTINTAEKTISATVYNFSVFILALDDPTATCSDNIQNQGETGIDCGGPCSVCPVAGSSYSGGSSGGGGGGSYTPAATCSDGIQNQNEVGIDCGGVCNACIGLATCSDGLQNQGETGIDCGGPCSACSQSNTQSITGNQTSSNNNQNVQTVTQPNTNTNNNQIETISQPTTEQTNPVSGFSPWLWIMIGFVIVGGIIVLAIEAPRKGQLDETVYRKLTVFPTDDNVVSIARYFNKQRAEGHDDESIKKHLIDHDYSQIYVDVAVHSLERKTEINKIIGYFEEYSRQGFSLQEMATWLDDKGVDEDLLAIAIDEYKRKSEF